MVQTIRSVEYRHSHYACWYLGTSIVGTVEEKDNKQQQEKTHHDEWAAIGYISGYALSNKLSKVSNES